MTEKRTRMRMRMRKSTKMQQKLKRTTKHSMLVPQVCYSTLVSQATRILITQESLAILTPVRVARVAKEVVMEGKVAAVVAAAFHVAPCFLSLSTRVTQVIRILITQANLVILTPVRVARVAKEVAVAAAVVLVARVAREVAVAIAALGA